jgi:hypothetical protein
MSEIVIHWHEHMNSVCVHFGGYEVRVIARADWELQGQEI